LLLLYCTLRSAMPGLALVKQQVVSVAAVHSRAKLHSIAAAEAMLWTSAYHTLCKASHHLQSSGMMDMLQAHLQVPSTS
jgi:hypothetical protein